MTHKTLEHKIDAPKLCPYKHLQARHKAPV